MENNVAENTQITRWRDSLDKLRDLSIVASATWDSFPSGKHISDVIIYNDSGIKSLHYESNDLEDMIEELNVYYEKAKNADWWRRFWDGFGMTCRLILDAFTFLQLITYIALFTVMIVWLNGAGLIPEIIDAILEKLSSLL